MTAYALSFYLAQRAQRTQRHNEWSGGRRWRAIDDYQCDIILGSHRGMGHFQFSLPPSDFTLSPFKRWWSINDCLCDIILGSHRGRSAHRDAFCQGTTLMPFFAHYFYFKYIWNIFFCQNTVYTPCVVRRPTGRFSLSRTEDAENAELLFMRWWSIKVYQCDIFLSRTEGAEDAELFYEVVGWLKSINAMSFLSRTEGAENTETQWMKWRSEMEGDWWLSMRYHIGLAQRDGAFSIFTSSFRLHTSSF